MERITTMVELAQPSLFSFDVLAQLAPPWWSCLGSSIAMAGVAEAQRNHKRTRLERIKQNGEVRKQSRPLTLHILPEPDIAMPRTLGDCRGPGVCPVIRCQWNVLIDVRRSTDTETIVVGARGGSGKGISLALRRNADKQVDTEEIEEAMADAIVAVADQLPSTCLHDYIENPDLIPGVADPEDGGQANPAHMTLAQIGVVFGMTRERVRQLATRGLHRSKQAPEIDELDPSFTPEGEMVRR